MKKILSLLLFVCITNNFVNAQAVLPTSWSFATVTYPTGWTATGTDFYAASGNTPPACKFDNTGDRLEIFFNSAPGNVSYYLTGNGFSGGTFLVEESVNGSSWTVLRTITSPPNGTYTQFTDVPNSASRYIRFNYSVKVSGNIGLDDVNIAAAAASPSQEINIKEGTTTIVNGGSIILNSPVSSTTPHTLIVENLGTVNALNLASAVISGPDASDFSVNSFPATLNALTNGNLVIDFTPATSGTKIATLTITNDDSDENPYIINLYGVGGSFATEPTSQPTNLSFTNVKSYRFTASYVPAAGSPDGYIILRRDGSAVTDVPVDGSAYERGDIIGNSRVVYSGDITSFIPHYIFANSNYHFAVFSYNGPEAYRNYLTTSPLIGSVTTTGSMQPLGYYSGINTSNASFVTDLHNLINPHNMEFYGSYTAIMVNNFYTRDTVGDQRVMTCVYSGAHAVYSEPWDWTSNNFSREHSYCHQWMPTYPGTTGPEYQDYHQLFPTDQNNANAIRSNYPLGEVVSATYTFMGCKLGTNAQGQVVFEPRDQQKGDAARAIMYQAVCYTGVSGNNWGLPDPISGTIPYGQNQNTLKKWHYQDLPDNHEIARNDFVDSVQNNRNPFIDSVHFACYIDFTNMTHISAPSLPCNALGFAELNDYSDLSSLYPNPNSGIFNLNYHSSENQKISVVILDMQGKIIFTYSHNLIAGDNSLPLNFSNLSQGIYMVQLISETGIATEKLIIE